MRDIILNALERLNIAAYQIGYEDTESVELFFIRRTLDMRRTCRAASWAVTVYRDFEAEGTRYRGSSRALLFEGMDPAEVEDRLKGAWSAARYVKNPWFELYEGKREAPVDMPSTLADRPLEEDALLMAETLFAADTQADAFVNSAEIFVDRTRTSILSSAGTDVEYTRYEVKGEFVTQCKAPQDVEQFFQFQYGDLNAQALTEKARQAIAAVRDRAAAQKAPQAGTYSAVLSGDQVATLMEYYTERSQAPMIYARYSDWAPGKPVQGEDVRGEKLDLDLLPLAPYSEEGIPMTARPLVKDGVLQLIHGGNRFCRYLGVAPTGDYDRVGLRNGTVPLADLQKGCLCPVSFSDFQMDALTGRFGGEIRLAYLYTENGVEILTGGSVNGSLPEKQGDLRFSTERYDTLRYTGPFAIRIEGVEVAG